MIQLLKEKLFIFGCSGSFALCGLSLVVGIEGFSLTVASLVAERVLGVRASVLVAHGPTCSEACGILRTGDQPHALAGRFPSAAHRNPSNYFLRKWLWLLCGEQFGNKLEERTLETVETQCICLGEKVA